MEEGEGRSTINGDIFAKAFQRRPQTIIYAQLFAEDDSRM